MSDKIANLKEKFRLALTSTAKVISDDFDLINKSSENDKKKDLNSIEIDNLTKPSDFIKLRAETDSSALKKKFSNETIYRKNLPSNNSSLLIFTVGISLFNARYASYILYTCTLFLLDFLYLSSLPSYSLRVKLTISYSCSRLMLLDFFLLIKVNNSYLVL